MIDIVIPTYGQPELLDDCIKSVRRYTHNYRLFVSDDASPQPEMQEYLDTLEDVILLRSDTQRGFPANVNGAVDYTSSEYVCLLNSDTVVTRGWLDALAYEMRDPAVGMVGGKLLYPNGTIQHAGVAYDGKHPLHIWRGAAATLPEANVRREINCVTYACVLIRRTVWEQLEGLDECFAGGQFEDVNQCWSARELGWKVVYTPGCVVYHREHGSGVEWVIKSSDRNHRMLLEMWRGKESDMHLFADQGAERLAALIHQIRGAAIQHCYQFRRYWDHPLRLSQMAFSELPEVEKEWAREWAKRIELPKPPLRGRFSPEERALLEEHLPELFSETGTLLYVGAGQSATGLDDLRHHHITVLEAWEPNASYISEHFRTVVGDVAAAPDIGTFDYAVWWCGPECCEREDIADALAYLEKVAGTVVLASPWGKCQRMAENPYDAVVTTLTLNDLRDWGYQTDKIGKRGAGLVIGWRAP